MCHKTYNYVVLKVVYDLQGALLHKKHYCRKVILNIYLVFMARVCVFIKIYYLTTTEIQVIAAYESGIARFADSATCTHPVIAKIWNAHVKS